MALKSLTVIKGMTFTMSSWSLSEGDHVTNIIKGGISSCWRKITVERALQKFIGHIHYFHCDGRLVT